VHDCSDNFHEFRRFPDQLRAFRFQTLSLTGIKQSQPVAAFLGFLPADLYSQLKVLLAQGFIGLDVVGADRSL